ncbi:hypothetical protein JCM10207_001341 [Rhodosporidiobolus poonsookiae]
MVRHSPIRPKRESLQKAKKRTTEMSPVAHLKGSRVPMICRAQENFSRWMTDFYKACAADKRGADYEAAAVKVVEGAQGTIQAVRNSSEEVIAAKLNEWMMAHGGIYGGKPYYQEEKAKQNHEDKTQHWKRKYAVRNPVPPGYERREGPSSGTQQSLAHKPAQQTQRSPRVFSWQ